MMPTTPELDALAIKVRAFLLTIAEDGIEVIQGPVNRAAQPKGTHCMFTFLFQRRLRTNVSTYEDGAPAGLRNIEQGTELHMQLDYYAASDSDMQPIGKLAVAVSTLWRDEYGVDALAPEASPLFIDDARGAPLALGEEQYVGRWISTGVLQYNPVTSVPQEFADEADVTVVLANALEIAPL